MISLFLGLSSLIIFAFLSLRCEVVLVEQTVELGGVLFVQMSLGDAPRVNAFLLELLHVEDALRHDRTLQIVEHYLERSPVVDCHA